MSALHRLKQGLENKAAQVHAGMGQHQLWVVKSQITPEEQIQIQAAWSPALLTRSIPTKTSFQMLQATQKIQSSR